VFRADLARKLLTGQAGGFVAGVSLAWKQRGILQRTSPTSIVTTVKAVESLRSMSEVKFDCPALLIAVPTTKTMTPNPTRWDIRGRKAAGDLAGERVDSMAVECDESLEFTPGPE